MSDRGEVIINKKNNLQEIMTLAIETAKEGASRGEVPIGAVLVCDGRIIARAHNQKESLADPTAHAEMLVIRAGAEKLGRWRLGDCQLYVTAEPCVMCMGAIIQARIPLLVYGAAEKKFGGVESTAWLGQHPMLPKQMEIYAGICEQECEELLKAFFEKRRIEM
ncbi:nucleoside deaminase [Acetobacterium sp.]|jgi:tRNA(adenine34) deaminase|uniref:nucleoside deaminase n=1 Tax=Acetobacterium sp. TaxID=1872094 RepID=UPI000CB2ACAB|nr:nucleoside deaminase [Acetobacterium sp.]MDO9493380.1 nucleoside deaminase [Acetobacterium sp.]PKM74853.1 MAG: nucleoside deaminase [Firmicutes bacterium HGW-Firmicutes-17]